MKKNEKAVSILVEESGQNKNNWGAVEKKNAAERLKKPLIFGLMGIVFIGCMYLIYIPSANKKQIENMGLNDSVPQPAKSIMQEDKQKAYEQEILEEKEQQKRNDLASLSDYWNEGNGEDDPKEAVSEEDPQSSPGRPGNPAVNSYRNAQSTLGTFYQDDHTEAQQLRRQLEEMKEKLAEKDVPAPVTAADQLALMEKSYQMAAKYLPSGSTTGEASVKNSTAAAVQKQNFAAFIPAKKSSISALYRQTSDSTFSSGGIENKNRGFHTAGLVQQLDQPKNSVKACIQNMQTIIGEGMVTLRLLEPAQTPGRTLAEGTMLTANAKIQAGRLQLKVTSIEVDGTIIPVDITVYDLDGQQGLSIPYSAEMNALTEMAGNMSQQSGTSLMMTQSAGQQVAADLSRGVVQGISGYFSKKVRAPKVTLKAGHQVFLISKK